MTRTTGPLDLVSAAVLVLDREGRIQQFNRASLELLGGRSGGHETSFFSLLPPGEPATAAAARFAAEAFPIELEAEAATARGARRLAWTLSRGERGVVVATGVDVTAWHRELDAVRAHEERLRMVINALPDPVFLKDGEGRWLEVNPKALEVFGLSGFDYRGWTDVELSALSPFFRDAFLWCAASDEAAWIGGTLVRAEETLPSPNGPARTYDTYKSPIFRPDGTRKGIVVLGRDISERVWAQEALRRSEARLRLILETAPDVIGLAGPDGKVEFVNPAAVAVFGVQPDELVGRGFAETCGKLFGRDGRELPVVARPFARAQAEGEVRGLEVELDRPDGRRVVLAFNATSTGPSGAVVFAAADVTRRAAIERMKSDFLKIASHELRTPLTPLRLLLDRSRRLVARGERIDAATLVRMERQVDTLAHLVDELLDVARLERGHFLGTPRTDLDLAALVGDVVADFRLHAEVALALELPSERALVSADRWALERVVSNLVDNALKYGGTDVEVKVAVAGDYVTVSVRDHGPGIAPEHRHNLFERFYRAGEASLRKPGLGLGLFITRELLRELGTDIELESAVGQGTTFRFTLPLRREERG